MSLNWKQALGLLAIAIVVLGVAVWFTLASDPAKPTANAPARNTPLTAPPPEQEGGGAGQPPNVPANLAR